MEITVANCLQLPSLQQAKVLGGSKGLNRPVYSISVLETANAVGYLSDSIVLGEEMVITGFLATPDNAELQCDIMRILNKGGESALILFYVGVFVKVVSEKLIALADELEFPLICMPENRADIPYSDVIRDVMELIIRRKLRANAWYGDPDREAEAEYVQALMDNDRFAIRRMHQYANFPGEKMRSLRFFWEAEPEKTAGDKELGKVVLGLVRSHYSALGIEAYAAVYNTAIVVLLTNDKKNEELDALHERLNEACPGILMAVLDSLSGPDAMRDACTLCYRTLHAAKQIFTRKQRFTRHDLGFAQTCLHMLSFGAEGLAAYRTLIAPLRALDAETNGELMETLSTLLLDAQKSTAETAKYLFLHPNTVQYRLHKIREILGGDIFSFSMQYELTIALALHRLSGETI